MLLAILLATASTAPLAAQMHKVEAPERVTRAVAVYEWTGDLSKPTAARLVPITLFINGHFEDAGVYLARPVPFVLDTGNLFFVEQAGDRVGTFDIDYARDLVDRRSADDVSPLGAWYGFGKFAPPAPPAKIKPLKPSATVATIEGSDDDSRPHFVRRAPPKVASTPSKSGSSTSGAQPADDSDRPTMQRRTGSDSTTASTDDSDPDRPTLRRRDPAQSSTDKSSKAKSKPQASVSGPANSLNDDPDRPTLSHHSVEEAASTPELKGLPANLKQSAAVSDPANRDEHIFTRAWANSTEREQTLADLEALARPRIAAYLAANKLQPVAAPPEPVSPTASTPAQTKPAPEASNDEGGPPKLMTKAQADAEAKAAAKAQPARPAATPATAAHHTPPAHQTTAHARKPTGPTQLALYGEDLRGYELSYGGLPTFVYSVQSPVAIGGPVYLTLVAQRLPSGELQIALHSITDATHLDSIPWMRPVDVVDPDASHRASLLFELRAQHSRQFALYRLVTAEAEQTFVTGIIE